MFAARWSPRTTQRWLPCRVGSNVTRAPLSDRRAFDEQPELACYLIVAAATGARRSEVVALRWADVDLEQRTVSIGRGVVMGMERLVERDTKTHSSRRVSLDARTVAVLSDQLDRMRHRAEVCRVEISGRSFVFSNAADFSEPWSPTRCPERSSACVVSRACRTLGCTISGTWSPPRCSVAASTRARSPAASVIATLRRR